MNSMEKIQSVTKLSNLVRQKGFQRKFRANEIIFMENDQEDCLFYIAEGLVKLFIISQEGKEKTLHILSVGQIFGEIALVYGGKYCVNAQTLGDAVIYSISYKDVKEGMADDPGIALELLEVMADKVYSATQQVRDMVFHDIAGRIASQIFLFSEQFGVKTERGILIQIVLTHQEFANLLGASRVTVTKTINQFEEKGIIEIVNRRILIREIDKLVSYFK